MVVELTLGLIDRRIQQITLKECDIPYWEINFISHLSILIEIYLIKFYKEVDKIVIH